MAGAHSLVQARSFRYYARFVRYHKAKSKQAFTFDFDEQSGHSRLSVREIPQATNVVMQSIDRRA